MASISKDDPLEVRLNGFVTFIGIVGLTIAAGVLVVLLVRHVITSGALLVLCSAMMGFILPQPRILMAIARDGLLPSFFSSVHKRTQVLVNSTLVTGIFAASLAFFMDVSQLASMVNVGTLFSFTIVAISILVVRYLPPDEIHLPASLMKSIDAVSLRYSIQQKSEKKQHFVENSGSNKIQHDGLLQDTTNASNTQSLILKKTNQANKLADREHHGA